VEVTLYEETKAALRKVVGVMLLLFCGGLLLAAFREGSLGSSGLSSSGETMNIESIGGWDAWVLVIFFLVSQSVIVYHLKKISKSLGSQQKWL
jgi:hypothetical protein